MDETRRPSGATVREFDDLALEKILDRIAGGSAGYFAGTTPAAVRAAVERIQELAVERGIALSVGWEGELVVVRRFTMPLAA